MKVWASDERRRRTKRGRCATRTCHGIRERPQGTGAVLGCGFTTKGGHARAILSDLRGMSLKRRERETLLILHLHELLLMYIFLSRRPSFRTEEPATATAAAPTAIFLRYSKEGTRPSRLSDTPNHHKLPRARPSFPSLTLTTWLKRSPCIKNRGTGPDAVVNQTGHNVDHNMIK